MPQAMVANGEYVSEVMQARLEVDVICPLLGGPSSILELVTKEEWNGREARAGGDHRQAA